MGLYLDCRDHIGFDVDETNDDEWVRADLHEDGVSFDRAGLCKLGRLECRQLADWLLRSSDKLPEYPIKPKGKTGRPKGTAL